MVRMLFLQDFQTNSYNDILVYNWIGKSMDLQL